MADLVEVVNFEAGIYQLETTDPVEGGPGGIDNRQAQQLANRTAWLKSQQEQHAAAVDPHPQYMTEAESNAVIAAAVAALVASSPAALDTLNELATALGNDPNFVTTITNALGNKQPLDTTLTALAAIVTVADRLIYATGPDTFATATLTAFARTLLDDVDAATALATLGAAPLVSPAFVDIPTAPTAAPGTNTLQLANTAFIQQAIAALVNASPATLDTLNELATALGNDPNFATTITNSIAQKLPLSGGALTGPLGIKIITETKNAPAIAAGALLLDLSACSLFDVTLNASITDLTISNPPANGTPVGFTLIFTADGTARAIAWPASVKWPGGIAPTMTVTNGKKDFLSFITYDAGLTYYGFVSGQNL